MSNPKSSKKPVNRALNTIDDTVPSASLTAKLKACDPEVQNYITALKAENLKLQQQIAKHQAHEVTQNNRIKVLEEEQYRPKVEVNIVGLKKESEK